MKNALILHGTDFHQEGQQSQTNWFPWLKKQLEAKGHETWLPELPEAWQPNLQTYWEFLQNFDFNDETILIGHSSGAAAILGLLHKLPAGKRVELAILVAGFYKDEGWNCEGLFTEKFDWWKIKNQAKKIILVASDDDPYISMEQTNYLANKTNGKLVLLSGQKHMSVGSYGGKYKKFPLLVELVEEAQ